MTKTILTGAPSSTLAVLQPEVATVYTNQCKNWQADPEVFLKL